MKIACVVGARPNFVKIAPIIKQLKAQPDIFQSVLVHTGQHYDQQLFHIFFEQLGIAQPDHELKVGPGSVAVQTALIIQTFDALCATAQFDRVLLVGDVTSTLACAIVAAKRGIPIDHVEAGLRSFDRSMPEEINRIVTDALADTFFVTEPAGVRNLLNEGHAEEQIKLVGNVMIDSLFEQLERAKASAYWQQLGLSPQAYGVVTLHRPSNVDDGDKLRQLMSILQAVSQQVPLVFPVHPRTLKQLAGIRWSENMHLCEPLGYLEFLGLIANAKLVLTDSGGIQEETTVLGVPCLTLRSNTERPITVEQGTNTLVDPSREHVLAVVTEILAGSYKTGQVPTLWDGHASERIVAVLAQQASDGYHR